MDLPRTRAPGVPTQYRRGVQKSCGHGLHAYPQVLIPRLEAEHLVEAGRERLWPGDRTLDTSTGAAAIAVDLAWHVRNALAAKIDSLAVATRVVRANAVKPDASIHCLIGVEGSR